MKEMSTSSTTNTVHSDSVLILKSRENFPAVREVLTGFK